MVLLDKVDVILQITLSVGIDRFLLGRGRYSGRAMLRYAPFGLIDFGQMEGVDGREWEFSVYCEVGVKRGGSVAVLVSVPFDLHAENPVRDGSDITKR